MTTPTEYTLTAGDVADQIGCGLSTITRWAEKGEIPFEYSPGGWRKFRQVDVDTFKGRLPLRKTRAAS